MQYNGGNSGEGLSHSKFIISHKGPMGTSSQQSAAAAFFARNASKTASPVHNLLQVAGKTIKRETETDFTGLLEGAPPPTPSYLLKRLEHSPLNSGEPSGGRVKVLLRVHDHATQSNASFSLDRKKKQVTLLDPAGPTHRAPKLFAFDGVFTESDSQIEVAGSALCDSIYSVLNGTDGCVFSFGHARLGKTRTMIGVDDCAKNLGIIPTAISWLFKCIKENKHTTARPFVRVSAVEILCKNGDEELRDLLLGPESSGEHFGYKNPNLLQRQTESKCSSPEKAAEFLDIALGNRQASDSHFVYILSIYRADNCSEASSRLYLVDFGSCDRGANGGITQSNLGNVILGIFNRSRHLPSKESKVTQMIKECLSSSAAKATMIAHVSPESSHYSETLHTLQLASRIHRMRRSKRHLKGSGSSGSGSSDDAALKSKLLFKSHAATSSSDFTDPSSSEQSCDTVIYVGPRDDEGTDAEHPPVFIPNLNSGDHRGIMSRALRGLDIPNGSSLERWKKTIPSTTHSTPLNGFRHRPGSIGSTPARAAYNIGRGSLPRNPKGKMPLYGKVAGYRQSSALSAKDRETPPDMMKPHVTKLTADQQHAIYGYMDDFKRGMISQWVNEQSSSSPKVRNREPEPFAWLKESEDLNEKSPGCKVLTTFKTADSSEESSEEKNEPIPHLSVADVHHHHSLHSGSSSTSPPEEPEEILRISDNVAELILDQPSKEPEPPKEEEKSQTQAAEEVSSSSSSCPPPIELKSESLHYIAAKKMSSSYSVNNEEDFSALEHPKNIDQLAKLHELYQSVSSINAKSQNRLRNVPSDMGSCFSLGAHPGGEEESSLKSDLNSLCSEPVIQRIEDSALDIEEAMNDLCKFTVSLSDLKKGMFLSRSDSPVLEGMDRELAKYAKLKDLDSSYDAAKIQPPLSTDIQQRKKSLEKTLEDQISQLEQLRHPDGASNPDLNKVPPSRRSPGNGRSDPEIEEDQPPCNRLVPRDKSNLSSLDRQVLGKSSSSSSGSFVGRPKEEETETISTHPEDSLESIEPAIKSGPKFSRLFSGSKKYRSKEKKSTTTTPQKAVIPSVPREETTKKSSSARRLKFFSRSSHKAKNALSTPSSHYSPRSKKASKSLSSTYIPSPYSFPSAPIKKTTAGSSSTSSGRGSTTGYESGGEITRSSRTVKIRGRGAHSNHCKSSGYESVSERDSVEEDIKIIVSDAKEDEPVTLTRIPGQELPGLPPVNLLNYEGKQVERLDRRWRFWEFSRLKDRQKNLKVAMKEAKTRISRSSSVRWSYELHLEENSGVSKHDPAFIDALRKETDILQKRVEACKAHANLMTCFDAVPSDPMKPYLKKQWENCCTTDCDPAGSMAKPLDPRESEIF